MTFAAARKQWRENDDLIRKNINIVMGGCRLTQAQLANMLGITDKTLRSWIKNPQMISVKSYRIITYLAEKNRITIEKVM